MQLQQIYRDLIMGSHILHYHGVLDAYGHISARNPDNPATFIMPRDTPPANIASSRDLVEYHVANASAVDSAAPKGYIERYIHSEVYKRYPDVQSVVHSHAPEVIPYTISGREQPPRFGLILVANVLVGVPLKPTFHFAGLLGSNVPVWDISDHYQSNDTRDLLVRNEQLGGSLASYFDLTDTNNTTTNVTVVLMRGHGFTATAPSVRESVFRAYYTSLNAQTQTTTLTLSMAYHQTTGQQVPSMQYLRDDELGPTLAMGQASGPRAWSLWTREVQASPVYRVDE